MTVGGSRAAAAGDDARIRFFSPRPVSRNLSPI